MANLSYFLQVNYKSEAVIILVTEEGKWSLAASSRSGEFARNGGTSGTFERVDPGVPWYHFTASGASDYNFKMHGVTFPPNFTLQPSLFFHDFLIGELWSKALGYPNAAAAANIFRTKWEPLASGPFMEDIKVYCAERIEELKKLALQAGLEFAAIVDPTGIASGAAAIQASRNGDYLGCALNLVGVIPLLGKLADAAAATRVANRMRELIPEVRFLTRWLERSKTVLSRVHGASIVGLESMVQVGGAMVKAARQQLELRRIVNLHWLKDLHAGAELHELGILPAELKAFSRIAREGYYFVVRSCNPERVRWLTWAQKNGARMLSKPLWIKAKSLKGSDFLSGLVGYKIGQGFSKPMLNFAVKAVERPSSFNPSWLRAGNGSMIGLYKIEQRAMKLFEMTDWSHAESHYLAEVSQGGERYLILCDAKGAAYVSDLDVVLIQRQSAAGHFAPPGMNVGPAGTKYIGGDNAALRPFWNKFFRDVEYPPGYEPLMHGEATGTAGNFKPAKAGYDPALQNLKTVWGPGSTWDSERLIVAVNAEHLANGVGVADNWTNLKRFHDANRMGEFRIHH